MTNFTKLRLEVARVSGEPGRMLIMRNQAAIGMNNNYWPCLSRLLIMGDPWLVEYINPHYIEALDSPPAAAMLCLYYNRITGSRPKVSSWKVAKQRNTEGDRQQYDA
ncbi:MAG: hypothetical protein RSB04_11615 [Gordonibacter sp.]|uniref:hypothetical protein n=1 Tax=Gordonibacter sp. TaxID=1968902 RepID=UPI002FC7714E